MSIQHTRALLNAALEGKLGDVQFRKDPIFGFEVPVFCEGVPEKVLDPAQTWPSRDAYKEKYEQLARLFIENFKKYMEGMPTEILKAGPSLK